jgi:hypothetical protein
MMKKNLLAAFQFRTQIGDIRMTTYLPSDCVRFLCLPLLLIASFFCGVMFHVLFEVSLLVEVRLRGSFSAPKRTPVANDAPALLSAFFLFSFDNNKIPKQ